jgi:hypothetical protein
MAFHIVDLMVDVLPEGESAFAMGGDNDGCTGTSCRAAGTKAGTGVRRPRPAAELDLLRDQLRLSMA